MDIFPANMAESVKGRLLFAIPKKGVWAIGREINNAHALANARDFDIVLVQDGCTRKACRCLLVSAVCAPPLRPDGLTRSRVFALNLRLVSGHDNRSRLL